MLDHVALGVADLERSRHFYDATLRPVGLVRLLDFESRGSDYGSVPHPHGVEFTITAQSGVVDPSRGAHLCFRAPNREALRAFHAAALALVGWTMALPGCGPSRTFIGRLRFYSGVRAPNGQIDELLPC